MTSQETKKSLGQEYCWFDNARNRRQPKCTERRNQVKEHGDLCASAPMKPGQTPSPHKARAQPLKTTTEGPALHIRSGEFGGVRTALGATKRWPEKDYGGNGDRI